MIRRVIAFLLALGVLAFVAVDKTQGQEKQTTPAANPAPSAPTAPTGGIADLFSALAAAVPRSNIGPDSSENAWLPVPPNPRPIKPALVEKLNQVPEVEFQAPMAKNSGASTMRQSISHLIERINHLNKDKPDHFVEALRDNRADVKGLPFAMGKACRMQGQRALHFETAVRTLRRNLTDLEPISEGKEDSQAEPKDPLTAELFWKNYKANIVKEEWAQEEPNYERQAEVQQGRIAAMMQVLAPESAPMRLGLVRYLAHISHPDATHALARLAVFSFEDSVRQAAIDALKTRRERDYTGVLLQGLRYPLPAVARHASEAVVKLGRNDLVPQLVSLLDKPDPRAPVVEEIDKKKVPIVHELVKVNHHRSCLMCHAPGDSSAGMISQQLMASIPVPGEKIPPTSQGYGRSFGPGEILVRIDVTYLRQDFSRLQPVADAAPWPAMQRFDFLVRRRELTANEAEKYQKLFAKSDGSDLSPYQRATVDALAALTGKKAEPTSQAWRKLLGTATP